jgi:hypothetical protein
MTGDLEELVTATVAGQSLTQIAAAAGVSVSTAQRRLKEPEGRCCVEPMVCSGRLLQ